MWNNWTACSPVTASQQKKSFLWCNFSSLVQIALGQGREKISTKSQIQLELHMKSSTFCLNHQYRRQNQSWKSKRFLRIPTNSFLSWNHSALFKPKCKIFIDDEVVGNDTLRDLHIWWNATAKNRVPGFTTNQRRALLYCFMGQYGHTYKFSQNMQNYTWL